MENYKEFLFDKDWLTSKGVWLYIFQSKESLKYYFRGGILDEEQEERYRFSSPILGIENKDEMLDEANILINKMIAFKKKN